MAGPRRRRRCSPCSASPVAPELARTLDLGGYRWKAVAVGRRGRRARAAGRAGPARSSTAPATPTGAWAFARTIRKREPGNPPVLVLVSGAQLADLELRDDLFDDFCLAPFHPAELEARLRHLLWRVGGGARPDMIEYRELSLNLETYQASIAGRPLDLTYMEYELLKFLAQNPGKVFTREMLLNRVWGYEYYGGARTVDVHVRRLRAKLGEEHAGLIQTVRSVGYRFGQSRWGYLSVPLARARSSDDARRPSKRRRDSARPSQSVAGRTDDSLAVHRARIRRARITAGQLVRTSVPTAVCLMRESASTPSAAGGAHRGRGSRHAQPAGELVAEPGTTAGRLVDRRCGQWVDVARRGRRGDVGSSSAERRRAPGDAPVRRRRAHARSGRGRGHGAAALRRHDRRAGRAVHRCPDSIEAHVQRPAGSAPRRPARVGVVARRRRRPLPRPRRARRRPRPHRRRRPARGADRLFHEGQPDVTWADALVDVAARGRSTPRRWPTRVRVDVFLDAAARHPRHVGRRVRRPDASRRHSRATAPRPVFTQAGRPLSVGRAQHVVPDRTSAARRAARRQVPCAVVPEHPLAPGAPRRALGGRRSHRRANLIALCGRCHRQHHRGQLGITGDAERPDGLTFTDARGSGHRPGHAADQADRATTVVTVPPDRHPTGERLETLLRFRRIATVTRA